MDWVLQASALHIFPEDLMDSLYFVLFTFSEFYYAYDLSTTVFVLK